jgi:hypothetical protein
MEYSKAMGWALEDVPNQMGSGLFRFVVNCLLYIQNSDGLLLSLIAASKYLVSEPTSVIFNRSFPLLIPITFHPQPRLKS